MCSLQQSAIWITLKIPVMMMMMVVVMMCILCIFCNFLESPSISIFYCTARFYVILPMQCVSNCSFLGKQFRLLLCVTIVWSLCLCVYRLSLGHSGKTVGRNEVSFGVMPPKMYSGVWVGAYVSCGLCFQLYDSQRFLLLWSLAETNERTADQSVVC